MLIRKVKLSEKGEVGARFRIGNTIFEIKRITETRVHLACDGPDAIEWLDKMGADPVPNNGS